MSEIDEFKRQLRGEVEAGRERIETMQTQAAEQYQRMQANYVKFQDVSQRIRDALRPWVKAFGESLPDVTPVVTQRDFGPAGRVFHGVFVTFSLPRTDRCPYRGVPEGVRAGSQPLRRRLSITLKRKPRASPRIVGFPGRRPAMVV